MILNFILAYGCYFLGALLFFLDVIDKYKKLADNHPDPNLVFNGRVFLKKEWVNIVRVFLLGIATMILLIPLGGIKMDIINAAGDKMFTTSVKVLMFPLYLIFGWSGGSYTMKLKGVYKKQFDSQVGIKDE